MNDKKNSNLGETRQILRSHARPNRSQLADSASLLLLQLYLLYESLLLQISRTSPFRREIGFTGLKEACLWSGLAVGEGRQTALFETAQEEDPSFEAS